MNYSPRKEDPLYEALNPVVQGLGMSIVELSVSKQRGKTQIRLTVTKKGVVGVGDCSRVHHAIVPRLELAFPGEDLYIEVASPGIDRTIKDASEFQLYIGRGIRCYRTDISDWTAGILQEADDPAVLDLRPFRMRSGRHEMVHAQIERAEDLHLLRAHHVRHAVGGAVAQSRGEGDAAARCGISMKGIDIVVGGSVGHMSAFMAQAGTLVVLGDAGDALGDSIYEARLYVRGSVKSLGADCIEKPMREEHIKQVQTLLEKAGFDADPKSFKRYGSARKLYNFHVDNAGAY